VSTTRRRARDRSPQPSQQRENGSGEVYTYTDESGKPLFHVIRRPGKQFVIRRADGVWGLRGTKRVLYRLPQVLAAAREGQVVYVVEGEKDVHSAEAAGAVATTNPNGANAPWKDDYSECLFGASVIIVWDRDDEGRRHAHDVAGSLKRHGIKVRFRCAREGKDLTDHLEAGHGLDDLLPNRPKRVPRRIRTSSYGTGLVCPVCGGSGTLHQDRKHSVMTGQMAYFFYCDGCPTSTGTSGEKDAWFRQLVHASGKPAEQLKSEGLS
jgi:hypothetical protein